MNPPFEKMATMIQCAEEQMVAKLSEARATFKHAGTKGDHAEDAFRSFLRKYLPRRIEVGHGEVIDKDSSCSRQTDVVVASEEHPFTFAPDEAGLFFIEGVSAAGEVKSVLTSGHLSSSIQASAQFKKLKSRPPAGALARASEADHRRWYSSPPYFLVAYESQLSLEKIHEVVSKHQAENPTQEILDAVFVLGRGSLFDLRDGTSSFKMMDSTGVRMQGWCQNQRGGTLFSLLAWLSVCMPRWSGGQPIIATYLIPTASPTGRR